MRHSSVKSFQVAANFANMQIIRLLLFYRHFHAEINKFCRLFPWLISALNIKIPFAFLYGFHWAHCINHFRGKDKFFKSCFSASLKHFQVVYWWTEWSHVFRIVLHIFWWERRGCGHWKNLFSHILATVWNFTIAQNLTLYMISLMQQGIDDENKRRNTFILEFGEILCQWKYEICASLLPKELQRWIPPPLCSWQIQLWCFWKFTAEAV